MEQLSIITIKKFKDTIERILHVPGNYRGGILEMAVVVDTRVKKEHMKNVLPQLLKALKQQGQIFKNVRFNYVTWAAQKIENQVCPMMQPMMESFYENYAFSEEKKDFGELVDYLKLFQARAKVVILLTNQEMAEFSGDERKKRMQPFLDKKLLIVNISDDKDIEICYHRNL